MKWKIFALLVATMFIATTGVATAATPIEELIKLDGEAKTFSGYVGMGLYGRERGIIKGLVATCPNPGPGIAGIIVMRNGQHYLFKAHLAIDCGRPGNAYRGKMISGLIYGNIVELNTCGLHSEGCCYEINGEYCCLGFDGPFTGDFFYYNGWLMGIGNWRGNDFWFRAYVGSWTYPALYCHVI